MILFDLFFTHLEGYWKVASFLQYFAGKIRSKALSGLLRFYETNKVDRLRKTKRTREEEEESSSQPNRACKVANKCNGVKCCYRRCMPAFSPRLITV